MSRLATEIDQVAARHPLLHRQDERAEHQPQDVARVAGVGAGPRLADAYPHVWLVLALAYCGGAPTCEPPAVMGSGRIELRRHQA